MKAKGKYYITIESTCFIVLSNKTCGVHVYDISSIMTIKVSFELHCDVTIDYETN
jgi:hypothetical protein